MNKSLREYDFFAPEVIESPFEFYRLARREAPVYLLPGSNVYLVTTYDLVVQALARPEVYSNKFSALLEGRAASDPDLRAITAKGWPQVDTLLTNDPPSHTRFSKLVNKAFSLGRVKKMEGYIRDICDELIDAFADAGECEFSSAFAVKLPIIVIADQLGVPRTDLDKFKRWSDAFVERLGGMASKEAEREAAELVLEFQHYMIEKCNARRTEPRDDILSDLVHAQVDGERPLDDAELLNIIQQLLVAGNETTTNALTGGLLLLIQHPEQMAKVRRNPALIPNLVEEVLRLEAPTAGMWRVVKQDTELGGVAIPAGSMVHLRYAAANRDADRYPEPEDFDVDRKNAKTHLAFGRGIHMCIGAMLARKEMTVALERLLARLDAIRLAEGRNDLKHFPNMLLRGLQKLYIEFDKAA